MNDWKIHEKCAVFGASLTLTESAGITYNGLLSMQHRGQEGAGIAVVSGNRIVCHKNVGLVSEVFSDKILMDFPKSGLCVGHTRYSTTGNNTRQNVQPFVTEYLTGRIATAHNGNITNAKEIREWLQSHGVNFMASSDSEVISSFIAYKALEKNDLLQGVISAAEKLKGAFSFVIISNDNKLIAVRDPNGFRPLCIGQNEYGTVVASESCALDCCGFSLIRDVQPGEVVMIENGKITHSSIPLKAAKVGFCIFEYVYFARPDSVINNLSVYEARFNMGRILARECPADADVVCGVPDSGLAAASGYAEESGIPLVTGFIKNRYIGRSFIYPVQAQRESAVHLKLNPLKTNIEGKRIVLIDDSIVRGTTGAQTISALRSAGAKEVHMRLSSPPFKYTCYFGIDIGSEKNLIANNMSLEQIRKAINVETLGYISKEGLLEACKKSTLPFCMGCFTGKYNTEISDYAKSQFE